MQKLEQQLAFATKLLIIKKFRLFPAKNSPLREEYKISKNYFRPNALEEIIILGRIREV